ncbi:hypothetical protein COCVIDRAFT_94756, partial [Bipolaris victoriae FI3]
LLSNFSKRGVSEAFTIRRLRIQNWPFERPMDNASLMIYDTHWDSRNEPTQSYILRGSYVWFGILRALRLGWFYNGARESSMS